MSFRLSCSSLSPEGPGYLTAMRGLLITTSIVLAIDIFLYAYYVLENKRMDRLLENTPQELRDDVTCENKEFADRTNMEDFLKFRYSW